MLTARPLNAGTQFKSFGNTTSGWGSGQSIDQYLAERFGAQTTFKSLQLGVHVRDTEVRARISYRGSNQPNPPAKTQPMYLKPFWRPRHRPARRSAQQCV